MEQPAGTVAQWERGICHRRAPHVFAQRLGLDAQVTRDVRDRTTRLEHQLRASLQQLPTMLPRSCHDQRLLPPH
jgi:hypothetical protein